MKNQQMTHDCQHMCVSILRLMFDCGVDMCPRCFMFGPFREDGCWCCQDEIADDREAAETEAEETEAAEKEQSIIGEASISPTGQSEQINWRISLNHHDFSSLMQPFFVGTFMILSIRLRYIHTTGHLSLFSENRRDWTHKGDTSSMWVGQKYITTEEVQQQ